MIELFLRERLDAALAALGREMEHAGIPPTLVPGGLIHPQTYRSNAMGIIQSVFQLVLVEGNREALAGAIPELENLTTSLDVEKFEDLDIRSAMIRIPGCAEPMAQPIWVTPLGGILIGFPQCMVDDIYDMVDQSAKEIEREIIAANDNIRPLRP